MLHNWLKIFFYTIFLKLCHVYKITISWINGYFNARNWTCKLWTFSHFQQSATSIYYIKHINIIFIVPNFIQFNILAKKNLVKKRKLRLNIKFDSFDLNYMDVKVLFLYLFTFKLFTIFRLKIRKGRMLDTLDSI